MNEPKIIESEKERKGIITNGQGFVFNDTWWKLHKASCCHNRQMKIPLKLPYDPMQIDPHWPGNCSNGAKLYWNNKPAAVSWLNGHRSNWTMCSYCNP